MGAVLISRNDVAVSNPGLAARIEEALARAVARSPRAFRASVEAGRGDRIARVWLEEHPSGDGSTRREASLDLTLDVVGLRRTIDSLLR
jgi:hypothetical protein